MKFSEKLYNLRKKSGMSQEQLAEKLEVSRQAVSKWETGDASPEAAKLLAIARLFNVTTDFLLDDETDEYTNSPPLIYEDTLGKILSSVKKTFQKHGWILGILLAVFGLWRVICILPGIGQFGFAASSTGDLGFIFMPVLSALSGVVFIGAGIFIAVSLRRKSK